ncbi:serine hydrolase [Candidatus Bathyarchaeota archaeon]|nr:serine hydrolase [Candidatus Bathyarchaeota archaeon]
MVDEDIIKEIERFVDAELGGRKHPGSSLSLIDGDNIVWSKGFGYSNVDEKSSASPTTVYRCASVTKPVVTVGLLQLMEEGEFNLDDEVNRHLDIKIRDVNGEQPTIRDLLTHQSGMPTRVPPIFLMEEEPLTMRSYIESAARSVRPRGEKWAYCNTAYMIVGYLIELFTSQSYDEYVTEKVLKPLGMNSSAFTLTTAIEKKLAQGYKRAGGPENPLFPVSPYLLGTVPEDPAGSLYSTVLDLANFLIMNMNGGVFKGKKVLEEETINEMQKLQVSSGNSRSGMGLTWFYTIHDDHIMLNHTGGLPDFTNNVCFYPEERIGVCWLSNLQDGSGWRPPSPTVLRIALGEDPPIEPEAIQKIPENWNLISGIYGDELNKTVIQPQNGFMIMDDRLLLESITDFIYRVHGPSHDGDELTFELDEKGSVTQFCLGTIVMPRYLPPLWAVDESLELIGSWVGEYYDSTGFHRLELDIKGPSKGDVITPSGETIELSDINAQKGKVTGSFKYVIPEEYARWSTTKQADVKFEFTATDGKLKGVIRTNRGSAFIEMEKKQ